MKNWKDSFEIWTKIALTIHYIEQITFFFFFFHSHPSFFRSLHFVKFVHKDIYNRYKHLINLKLEFLAFDASVSWDEKRVELILLCVYNFIYFFSLPLPIARCCFRCHCLIIYVFYFSFVFFLLFLSLFSAIRFAIGRFIKQNEKKTRLFQCVLLFIINTRRSINTQTILNHSLYLYIRYFLFFLYCRGRCRCLSTKIHQMNEKDRSTTKEIEYVS